MSTLSLRELQEFDPRAAIRDGETRFCCPRCGQEKPRDAAHRSIAANLQTGEYKCHRCGAKGKLLEFHEERAERPQEGPRERRQRVNRQAFALPPPEEPKAPDSSEWKKLLRELAPDLRPLAGTPGAEYLVGRGIPCDLARAAGVRYHAEFKASVKSTRTRPAVVFPFRAQKGALVAVQGRCLDGQDPGKLSAGPIGQGVFATPGALAGEVIAITEAPIDALSLALAGLPAVALGGTGSKPWLKDACVLRCVLLATDADKTGDNAADALGAALTPYVRRCERLRPAGAKDWNELLQRGGIDALRTAVAPVLTRSAGIQPGGEEEPDRCACGAVVFLYGPDGTPYCREHGRKVGM